MNFTANHQRCQSAYGGRLQWGVETTLRHMAGVGGLCLFLFLLMLSGGNELGAGEFNPVLDVGDQAPAWKKLPGVDGKRHSLSDLEEKEIVVVVFTCNSCPIAVDYEDRIIEFAKKYCGPEDKAALVAINVNTIEEDRLPKMKERSEQKKFPFPYLYDETQEIGKAYGATYTPEFFVLNHERKIVYMGGMDDSSNPENITKTFLEPAMQAVLQGKEPDVTETVAIGCTIRYARERRRSSGPRKNR